MPTYVYACTNPDCGHRFETVQAFTDAALTECPVCGQRLRKVFGSVGVVFKGSGFYRNDSREKAGAGVGKGDGGAESSRSGEKASGDSASGGSAGSGGPGGDKVAAKSSDSAT
ncbi:MAG: FmdB family zinc ribbon protein, partial [bacterium]